MSVTYLEVEQVADDVIFLLGEPYVVQGGQRYVVPEGCRRLLAFVALQRGRVDRRRAAGSLWPEGSEDRASGNLRSTLWRLRGAGILVLESDKCSLFLRERTTTDLDALCLWADRLIDGTCTEVDMRVPEWTTTLAELLPGWYDEWVIFERERIRQRLLHALEVLSKVLRTSDRYGEAIDAAMEAVAVEPLRESAHRALAEAHLAEGNFNEARRAFLRYRDLARRDLGVEPSAAFAACLRSAARPGVPEAMAPTRRRLTSSMPAPVAGSAMAWPSERRTSSPL